MSEKKSFTLVRTGQFLVNTYGPDHCGTSDHQMMRYRVTCQCAGHSLDNRGFLFDQTKVQTLFESIKRTNLSCELLAHKSAQAVYKHVMGENRGCVIESLTVQLSPDPYVASVEFSWEKSTK